MVLRELKVFAVMVAVEALQVPLAAADGGPVLPLPTGKYPVGRSTVYMLDRARDDERGTQKDHKREFWSQIWYPAQSGSQGKPAAWMLPEWLRLGADSHDLLEKSPDPAARDAQKYLASGVVHPQEDVPVAASPKGSPVILLAPGSISSVF